MRILSAFVLVLVYEAREEAARNVARRATLGCGNGPFARFLVRRAVRLRAWANWVEELAESGRLLDGFM